MGEIPRGYAPTLLNITVEFASNPVTSLVTYTSAPDATVEVVHDAIAALMRDASQDGGDPEPVYRSACITIDFDDPTAGPGDWSGWREWLVVRRPGWMGWLLLAYDGRGYDHIETLADDFWSVFGEAMGEAVEKVGRLERGRTAYEESTVSLADATPAPTTTYVFRFTPAAAERSYSDWTELLASDDTSEGAPVRHYLEHMLEDLVRGEFNAQHTESAEAAEVMRQRFAGLVTVEERPYDDVCPF